MKYLKSIPTLILLGLMIFLVSYFGLCGSDEPTVPTTSPPVVNTSPTVFPKGSIVVAPRDSTGTVSTKRIRVSNPETVDEVVSVGDSTYIIVDKLKPQFFPEFQKRESRIRVVGPAGQIVTVVQPRSLFGTEKKIGFGINFSPVNRELSASIGVTVLRVWTIHFGASGHYYTKNQTFGSSVDASILVRENLSFAIGRDVLQSQTFAGLRYNF